MRKGALTTALLVVLFLFPAISGIAESVATISTSPGSDNIATAEDPSIYSGRGSALDVTFGGLYTSDSSPWSSIGKTYALDFTQGMSFEVQNATTAIWTGYVSVSPPLDVENVSFSVDFPHVDWKPISVTDPLGNTISNPDGWTYVSGTLHVSHSAITT
ncbi:MAG: hypothetical protein ACFE7R_09500, partial [Candidatus Hodarchaeota archaeon]